MSTQKEMKTLGFSKSKPLSPFSKVIDIFGDYSILAISSPGHTADHISYFINDNKNTALILGDLTLSENYFNGGFESNVDSKSTGYMQLSRV